MPSEKSTLAYAGDIADPIDLPNFCFMGGSVVSGFGTGVKQTSFDKGVNRFTWLMIRFILVMVPAVLLIDGFTKGDWLEALLFVAVAVHLESRQGRDRHVKKARDREAPPRDPEIRRDGCLVRR
jgi:P-type Mg2+ transporter